MTAERLAEEDDGWVRIWSNIKTIGGAVLLALVIRTCLIEAFEIDGPSMEPTLLNGDRVLVSKYPYGLFLPLTEAAVFTWGAPEPGNVVIVKSPLDGVDIVKRVIGVGGDHVEVRRGIVYRNGKPLPTEDRGECQTGSGRFYGGTGRENPYCRWTRSEIEGHPFLTSSSEVPNDGMPTDVPPGFIYVLGDHRDASNDSRNPGVGAIPVSRVKGRALFIYWPPSRMFQAVE